MPTVHIEEAGCRDCSLCVEICPTKVFEEDAGKKLAKVVRQDDCIGCTSCVYLCPSRCLSVTDAVLQRPFHRRAQDRGGRVHLATRHLQHQLVFFLLN